MDVLPLIENLLSDEIARIAPDASSRAMYGGTMFEKEAGVPKTAVCGIFVYAAHVSLEFTHGAELADKIGALEGAGKFRRHIKLTSPDQIESKHVAEYLRQAFAL